MGYYGVDEHDRRQFEGSCRGKRRWSSKRLAEGTLRVMKAKADPTDRSSDRLNVYKCKACRTWHIGHVTHRVA